MGTGNDFSFMKGALKKLKFCQNKLVDWYRFC